MERIRNLDRYPKLLLLALLAMAVVFAAVYGFTVSRVGFLYNDTLLVPRQTDGATLYEGRLDGKDCVFTATADTVTLVCGKTYGPYTLREDPAAIPADHYLAEHMTGVEILDGVKSFFRGGVMADRDGVHIFRADGSSSFNMIATMSDGTQVDMHGNIIDPLEPTPHTILNLIRGPKLEHKGHWAVYLLGLLLSAGTAVCILFADELFRFRLSFWVRDAHRAEPSDWALADRALGWTLAPITILVLYIMGLR